MEPKFDVEQCESMAVEGNTVVAISERPSRWTYLAATGLILGWIAEMQLFNSAGVILTTLKADYGPKAQYEWCFFTFIVIPAVLSPTAGALADRLGRRWFVVVGNLISIVGGIVCCTAHSLNVVIVGMAIAGLGNIGQHFAIAGISELFQRKHRGLAQGTLQFAVFPFTACGFIIAAAMVTYATWRWIFYLYIILSTLALVMTFLFYDPPLPQKRDTMLKDLQTIDWVQPILLTVGLASSGLGVGWACFRVYSWRSAAIHVPLWCGFALTALWTLRVRTYKGPNPLFPKEMFNKEMILICLIGTLTTGLGYIATFMWANEVESLWTTDLIKVGKYCFPAGFGMEVGVFLSALVVTKLGPTRFQLATACFCLAVFVPLQATLTPHSIRPALAYLSLAGVAYGFLQVLLPTMIQLTNQDQHIGATTGVLITTRYAGGLAGVAMSLNILDSRMLVTLVPNLIKKLVPLGFPETSLPVFLEGLEAENATIILSAPGISLAIIEAAEVVAKNTYADAWRISYYPHIAVGVAATILAFFFAPDITSRMDDSLAVQHGRPWFLRILHRRAASKSG